jgi:cobalamin biosynthesis protein CobD/CbiB
MEIQSTFYGIGIFFLIVTIAFFVMSYLEEVPSSIKAVLSVLFSVILFVLADYLRRLDK